MSKILNKLFDTQIEIYYNNNVDVPRGTMEGFMKMGLGRGLDSLLKVYDEEVETKRAEEPLNNYTIRHGDVEKIDINKIYTNPNQPRKNFDKESLNELAESIRIHGLIQPIVVNEMPDGYMIIAGERRFRACKICGLKEIYAIIKNY